MLLLSWFLGLFCGVSLFMGNTPAKKHPARVAGEVVRKGMLFAKLIG
jgi:hypothetical protein